jgi:hypothetical protein
MRRRDRPQQMLIALCSPFAELRRRAFSKKISFKAKAIAYMYAMYGMIVSTRCGPPCGIARHIADCRYG